MLKFFEELKHSGSSELQSSYGLSRDQFTKTVHIQTLLSDMSSSIGRAGPRGHTHAARGATSIETVEGAQKTGSGPVSDSTSSLETVEGAQDTDTLHIESEGSLDIRDQFSCKIYEDYV